MVACTKDSGLCAKRPYILGQAWSFVPTKLGGVPTACSSHRAPKF